MSLEFHYFQLFFILLHLHFHIFVISYFIVEHRYSVFNIRSYDVYTN